MIGTLSHLEALSNGQPSANRPRGLHPALFGPGGLGWSGVADRLCPILPLSSGLVLDRPFGNEPDGSISPCPTLSASTLPLEWRRRLLDVDALAAFLGRARLALQGGPITFYIGAHDADPTPDPVILSLIRASLVQAVWFDRMVLVPQSRWTHAVSVYESAGAQIGYEELPRWNQPEYWRTPSWTCCGQLQTFQAEQAKVQQFPIHPNRSVDERAIAGPITLFDTRDNVEASRAAMAKGQHVAANLLSPSWKAALTSTPTTPPATDEDGA